MFICFIRFIYLGVNRTHRSWSHFCGKFVCDMTGLEAVAVNTVLHYCAHCDGSINLQES